MGNNSSGPTPAVYYSPQYGVALGGKGLSPRQQMHVVADKVRMRRLGTRQKPVRKFTADRDSKPNRGADLSPSLYETNIRDSFYSTAESGFETLPECNEEDDDDIDEKREVSLSLKENYSMSSLKDRNDRYFSSSSAEEHTSSSPSAGKTVVEVSISCNDDNTTASDLPAVRTELVSSSKSSPAHKGVRIPDAHLLSAKKFHSYSNSEDYDYDPSLEYSESIRSFNSSGEEWSGEEEEKDVYPFPPSNSAMTDSQFRQSLMQRIREWSMFAEEYGKSRSPTPECASPQPRYMRRSHSLDRHIGEPAMMPEVDMSSSEPIQGEDCTIKNLECLETEFHDIQGEFESITSKLHELIERGTKEDGPQQQSPAKSSPSHLHHPPHRTSRLSGNTHTSPHHRPRTKWERMPSLSRSDSSRSSRASSVEFSWDCGEVGAGGEVVGTREVSAAESSQGVVGPGGDSGDLSLEVDAELVGGEEECSCKVNNIGEAFSITDYAESEWKGDTPKAKTIKQGYFSIPELFHCQGLRQVRGDNYCALRSTLFQILVGGHRVTRRWPGLISIVDRLHELNADSTSGLQEWNFAGRVAWEGEDDKFSKITHCVLSLYATIEEMCALPSEEERLARTLSLLNTSQRFDIELMEGLKLMMLFRANDLQRDMKEEADVPTFAWLMFARDTSPDVVSFVKNHLNCVGDSAGIDQVEMCLLGHCLGVKIRVARLDHHGQQEFDCTFPDEAPEDWPSACLLAEDDRHYNVPVA
ncbi:uncharacterized protein [Littorina saxatilis]